MPAYANQRQRFRRKPTFQSEKRHKKDNFRDGTRSGTSDRSEFRAHVDDKNRFQKSRDIGCYVGLRPRRSDSGQRQPQLRITKEGDPYLRTMLVQGAHYIFSRRGPDTDLKRWGLRLAERGGKRAKKKAKDSLRRAEARPCLLRSVPADLDLRRAAPTGNIWSDPGSYPRSTKKMLTAPAFSWK
jgi:Transposase IS116/IS110/IS902 family